MKIKLLLMMPLFIFLQGGGCSDDDDGSDNTNANFINFLDTTNDGNGGCNIQSDDGLDISCTYSAFYQRDGLSYTIAISHEGVCRSGTFNLRDNLDQPSNVYFILQVASNGVAVDTYLGFSGTVNLTDTGTSSSIRFNGTVINTDTGEEEPIEGFVQCPL
ncbi:hypothetical protein [uncultured Psychroserpens sp.]|uniref:hypothetical protein n=1 Tax=uncultured Psychroserpens sp. TaxID=255436 RepID=UPI00260A40CC|nr:hypothetical protein [uncultured Psychroserpens sp.]